MLNKAQANLAMARRDLRVIEQEFFMGNPTAGPSGRGDNQAFFPSQRRSPLIDRGLRERAAGRFVGRHRHVVNIRADGIAVVLGPLLRDVRIVAAALVDVDSGMVLDAWSAAATEMSTDLELIGAQHAEIVRTALALLRSWPAGGGAPGTCEVVLGADDGARHLLRTVPDPLGDRLVLAVVVNGSQRVLDRVRKRLEAVSVDALTAGPSMTRRPLGGGWSFEPPGPDVPAHPGTGLVPMGLGSRPSGGARPAGPDRGGMPAPRGAEQASMPGPRSSEPADVPGPRAWSG